MPKFAHFGGIQSKLIQLFLIVLVPVLLIETYIFYRILETHRSQELSANLEVARAVAKNFDSFIQYIVNTNKAIGVTFTTSPKMTDRDQNRILRNFQSVNPIVRSFFWVNPDGEIVLSSLRTYVGFDVSDRTYIKEIIAGRDWAISELIQEKATGKWAFTISYGIRDEQKKLLGIVAASIDPDHLDSVLKVERSKEAGVSLVDNKGFHVYRYPHSEYTAEQRNWLSHYPAAIGDSLKGKEVTVSLVSKIRGEKRLVAFVPIDSIGWIAAASRAEDETMKAIILPLIFPMGVVLFVTLLGFGVAVAFSRPISNAIIRLRDQALAFGQGEAVNFKIASGSDELKDLGLALGKMAEEVRIREELQEKANKELESFSYSVSHDLRVPLRAIDGFTNMILKSDGVKFDEETRHRFQVIRKNAEMMGRLIDDLLAFSRLGQQEVVKTNLDMAALIQDAWREFVTINPDRAMTLKMEPMPAALGDRALIRQVHVNLLGNAVKFTQGREATVIEAGSCIQDSEMVYYVRDNGVGFDMRFYDKLFGVFQRLHGDEEYKGTGIGLALVKRIINRHGGRVWAEGEVDKGATFYFTLPTKPE